MYLPPRLLPLVAFVLCAGVARAGVPEAVQKAEEARIAAVQKAAPSVLAIFGGDGAAGGGSGVVITPDGYALSNFHVTKPCGNAMKCGMADGRLYDAIIVGIDPTGDVALIKLQGRDDFPTAEMADSDEVRVGDWCFAMGNPFLLATDFQPTVTYGIVSGVHRYQYPAGSILEYADCIQTDASINPGNSGGPLFDSQGRLIGINGRGSFEKRGRVNVGVGYAISINQIKNFLGYLKSGRVVDHATLGARMNSSDDGRVVVGDILEDSDAYRRGLRYDDEIIRFGGRRIRTVNGFKNALGIYPKGWRVPLTYRRDGKDYNVLVRLRGVHRAGELEELTAGPRAPKPNEGDKPGGEKPDPKQPIPLPRAHQPQPIPDNLKDVFESRRGYANYHFNELNQQRVWDAFTVHGDFTSQTGPWHITGETALEKPFEAHLGDNIISIRVGDSEYKLDATGDLHTSSDPPGSGGLLVALHMWRRLLVEGIEEFGNVYYLGTAPWPGHDDLLDVLVATYAGVECRFYFQPATGHLAVLEFYRADSLDPCEIEFADYAPQAGRLLPGRLTVRQGDQEFAVLVPSAYQLAAPSEEQP